MNKEYKEYIWSDKHEESVFWPLSYCQDAFSSASCASFNVVAYLLSGHGSRAERHHIKKLMRGFSQSFFIIATFFVYFHIQKMYVEVWAEVIARR